MAERTRSSKPAWQIKIAQERIAILFDEAKKMEKRDPELAQRYIKLAKKIGMRYNVTIPKHLKRTVCKYCYSFIHPKSRRKMGKGILTYTCYHCKKRIRYPYR